MGHTQHSPGVALVASCALFFYPLFEPRFVHSCWFNFGSYFDAFLFFFRSWGRPRGSSVFEGSPKRNSSFGETKRLRNPPKGNSEQGPKKGPRKKQKQVTFWASVLAHLGTSWEALGALLAHFLAVSPPLAPSDPKREVQKLPKRGQETTKSCPAET